MPTVKGRFLNPSGAGVADFPVEIWQRHDMYGPGRVEKTRTDSAGRFTAQFLPPSGHFQYGPFHVRLKSDYGRLIYKSTENALQKDGADWILPDVTLAQSRLSGWLVTELVADGTPPRFSTGNAVSFFVDNEVIWAEVADVVRNATEEVHFQLFYLDDQVILKFDNLPVPGQGRVTGRMLDDEMVKAHERNVPVRLVIRAVDSFPYPVDSSEHVTKFFKDHGMEANVRTEDISFRAPMHAKYGTIDGQRAYIIGSPFVQEYYDEALDNVGGEPHLIEEPRRGLGKAADPPGLATNTGVTGVPIHDVSLSLRGPCVQFVRDTFGDYWKRGTDGIPDRPAPSPIPGGPAVQIVRTIPGGRFTDRPDGEIGVLEAYLRCFAEASEYIYLENQYFTEPAIVEAIRQALKRSSTLQIIAHINIAVDIPTYNWRQPRRMRELFKGLTPEQAQRFGAFSLWSHESNTQRSKIIRNYLHSKVAIADDKWMTVGSANLDGASLVRGEFGFTENDRNSEVNTLLFSEVEGLPASGIPAALRKRLWSEHLGVSQELESPYPGGWLALWRKRAADKLAALKATPNTAIAARILEWKPKTDPVENLQALGVKTEQLEVLKHARSFDFETGDWVPS